MQSWQEGVNWNDSIPLSFRSRWHLIYSWLSCLRELQISRWIGLGTAVLRVELYGSADASNHAYAAVVYLKVVAQSGNVTIFLLAGKFKIAFLTPLTIPWLVLSAAVLLARLIEIVYKSIYAETMSCSCRTDSSVVLTWLKQHIVLYNIANRIGEVQFQLPTSEWWYIPTEKNPADCISRKLLEDEFLEHSVWWQGPLWLPLS